jgi:predicted ATPase/class 3 adenylate cyclase/predicted negative regulator of RcsB-dependent stress response
MTSIRPSGTVTFLFTDIEGSTQHWEHHNQWMQHAFTRHEQILRHSMIDCGGYVYKMIGDAFQVAFATAQAALTAALRAQQALQNEDWGEYGPLRVRMALHTGVTEERGDDYVGPQLNRVARLLSTGYGGQVLLTHTTYDLVQDSLPEGVSLINMGEHRLKDLIRPEHIYQMAAPGLQSTFPPLKTLSNLPNNLPVSVTSFVGREKEISAVRELLTKHRLVTLTGPGGTGKSRLALQLASEMLETYPHGVWLIELAPLADPQYIAATASSALRINETPGFSHYQALIEYLRPKNLLMIFDNCEHLIEGCAAMIEDLLQACPGLHVLATSREILGMPGEVNYRCPSLFTPDLRLLPDNEELARAEAVRLFIERALSAQPTFATTPQSLLTVARICSRLDGIPLAIELAAARLRMLSVEGVAARLDDTFRLLTGGSRTVLPRQQTLRACIDWSFNLLSPDERALFIRLAVFAGGWTQEAAEQVCADPMCLEEDCVGQANLREEEILDLLTQLLDKSLVQVTMDEESETRYRLLETIRQYARERMMDSGDAPLLRDRHLSYYLLLSEEAEAYIRGKDQVYWLDLLEVELDNLRYALEWSLSRQVEAGLRLASALKWFWHIRGYAQEGIEWIQRLLEADETERSETNHPSTGARGEVSHLIARGNALTTGGMLTLFRYHPEQGLPMIEASRSIFESLGSAGKHGYAISLVNLANAGSNLDRRVKYALDALEMLQAENEQFYQAEALMILGHLYTEKKEFDTAIQYLEQSLALREEIHDLDGLGIAMSDLADLAFQKGEHEKAIRYLEQALHYFQEVRNPRLVAYMLSTLGSVALIQGNLAEAADRFETVHRMNQMSGDKHSIAQGLYQLANLSWEKGEFDLAANRFEELLTIVKGIDAKPFITFTLASLSYAKLYQGDVAQASALLKESVESCDLWCEKGYEPNYLVPAMAVLAEIKVALGQYEQAVRLFSFSRQSAIWNVRPMTPRQRAGSETGMAAARSHLGDEAFEAAWSAGREMTPEEAAALSAVY